MSTLFHFLLLVFLGFSTANEEPNNILLVGSELLNDYKRPIVQHFHSDFAEVDRVFNQALFNPNIVIVGNKLDHLTPFKDNKFVQFHSVESNASAIIFTLKGVDELNLEEIQTLHQLIYQTNGGLTAIEIGPSVIQTKSLLDYSAFCWATGHLTSRLASDVPNRVFLCNGIRPSVAVDILDEEAVVPLNKKIEPTVLPIAPEPRFWPTFVASAADADSKKQKSNKHTAQPNARHTRVYGKDKKKSDSTDDVEDVTESPRDLKLGCRYRYSCYDEAGIKTDKPAAKRVHSEGKSAEKQTNEKKPSKQEDSDDEDQVEVKIDDKETDLKSACKFRKSCYETGKLDMNAIRESKTVVPKEIELDKDDDERNLKVNCKYRKSCYETGKLDMNAIRESKTVVAKEVSKEIELDKDDDERNLKVNCKYRKSCYETGKLDLDAIQESKTVVPKEVQKEDSTTADTSDERALKLNCKYRRECIEAALNKDKKSEPAHEKLSSQERRKKKSKEPELSAIKEEPSKLEEKQSKNDNTPKRRQSLQKNDDQVEVNIDDNPNFKVECKYRRSCYATGHLDMDAIQESKRHILTESSKEEESTKVDVSDERAVKFNCKYRKSCIEEHLQTDQKHETAHEQSASHERKEKKAKEPEVLPVPIVVEEVREDIDDSEEETPEPVESSKSEEVEEEIDETSKPSKKSVRKSKESSTEFKKKDPNRYVNKFKTVGKYEKLPKSEIIEEEEAPIGVIDQNEADDVSAEISEPIEPEIGESESEEPEEIPEQETDVEPTVIHQTEESDDETDKLNTHTNKDDAGPTVSLQTKVACKYRKSCLRSGILPDLEAERKNAQIREATIAQEMRTSPTKQEELDRAACKYRKSCYSQFQDVQDEAKQEDSKRVTPPSKLAEDRKPKAEQKSVKSDESDDEEEEMKANQTVVDLNSITTADRLNCKYRTSCYSGITRPLKHKSGARIIAVIPAESPRVINAKCHQYYLSCREEMGLPPKEHAPKVDGRRLCRKKKPNEQSQ